jgi:cold shock CspA family protein
MWNADRGFGFIAVDGGGPDTFLHINDLKSARIDPDKIRVGDRLTFETASTRDGETKASDVRWPDILIVEFGLKAKEK